MKSTVSARTSSQNEPSHRWGELFGSAIAIITLALPLSAIVHYSASSSPVTPQSQNVEVMIN